MATITFKGKVESVWNVDDSLAYQCVRVPTLARRHCDMHAFRFHAKYRGIANSDMFPNALAKIRCERLGEYVRLDKPLREGVSIDRSGFLAVVTLEI